MADTMYVRRDKQNKLLLLKGGEIALAKEHCNRPELWHIAVYTEEGQHPWCVELDTDRAYRRVSPQGYSLCIHYSPGAGVIDFGLRWDSGHWPYPEIDLMHVWAFGIDLGEAVYPKAEPGEEKIYKHVATIVVDEYGHVTVNGKDAGFWPDMIKY